MVRTTSLRTHHPLLAEFKHRSSRYVQRPGYITLEQVDTLFTPTEEYMLPPKPPTPNVILRTDIMAQQRTRVAL